MLTVRLRDLLRCACRTALESSLVRAAVASQVLCAEMARTRVEGAHSATSAMSSPPLAPVDWTWWLQRAGA